MENLNNEPFGKEWKREMMKWNKPMLVDFLKQKLIEIQSLEDSLDTKYDQGYAAGYSEATSQAVQEIRDHYSPNN